MKNESVVLTGSCEAVIGINTLCYVSTLVKPLRRCRVVMLRIPRSEADCCHGGSNLLKSVKP